MSPTAGETAPFSALLASRGGVPQSFPFDSFAVHFHAPEFGEYKTRVFDCAGNVVGNFVDRELVGGRPRTIAGGVHVRRAARAHCVGMCCKLEDSASEIRVAIDHTAACNPKRPSTNRTCSTMAPFGNHLT